MTLSNFLKTDKESLRWFLLYPSGHEGPYSLNQLEHFYKNNKIDGYIRVWAEGLGGPVLFKSLLTVEEEPLDLPPLPEEEFSLPPLPIEEVELEAEKSITEVPAQKKSRSFVLVFAILGLVGFALFQWIKTQESFTLRRYPKMSLQLFKKLQSEYAQFDGWDKKIFFKEASPPDLSRIWLITSSFQKCEVDVTFTSIKDKLLSAKQEEVQFRSSGVLEQHVVEFSTFDFVHGSKIIPGLYEMDVMAKNCEWGSFVAKVANLFQAPDQTYMGRLKVILYAKGPKEFNAILDKLIKRKMEADETNKVHEESFWVDLQQKFQTLLAISLQIEQLLLDFIEKDAREFDKQLKPLVDQYAKKYGLFLARFVIENEKYFLDLSKTEINHNEHKKIYEIMLRSGAKKLGFETMKIIEDLQAEKGKMKRARLNEYQARVKQTFTKLKAEFNEKIIQTSEDRSP